MNYCYLYWLVRSTIRYTPDMKFTVLSHALFVESKSTSLLLTLGSWVPRIGAHGGIFLNHRRTSFGVFSRPRFT